MQTVKMTSIPVSLTDLDLDSYVNNEQWFIENHASGTLRKNKRLGMASRKQYLEERTAFHFGWHFQMVPRSRVTFGDAITEGDCKAITEAGWHIDRYIKRCLLTDEHVEAKYLHVTLEDESVKEGIGIVFRSTYAQWIPDGHIVYAIVAEYDSKTDTWKINSL